MSARNFPTVSSLTVKLANKADRITPITFPPYNWLKDAKIYNKKWQQVSTDWIIENADIIVLLFTARGVDRRGILKKFYHIYESTKYGHIPIEVIFLPMDDTEKDAVTCFSDQANWFTLRFDDILIHTLKFMYEITCIPHLIVFKPNCEMISYDGIADIDLYEKNAVISWLSESSSTKRQRRRSEDAEMYGPEWKFVRQEEKLTKYEYHRKFNAEGVPTEDRSNLPGYGQLPERLTKLRTPSKPTKDSKPPVYQVQPSEAGTETTKPSESRAKLPEGRSKSATIAVQPPVSQAQLSEGRSKSAGTIPSEALSKPSIVHIQLPDEHSMPLENQAPSEGGKPSKSRVQLPDDDKPLEGKASEIRSKSAVAHASESNVQVKESRSKSAKFSDDA